VPPPQKIFSILELKIATFGAFWVLFFYSSVAGFTRKKNSIVGLGKLAVACTASTQRAKSRTCLLGTIQSFCKHIV